MADKKITQLTALTTLSNDDLLVVVDDPSGTPVTKKITASNLKAGLAPTASPTFTGTVTLPTDTSVGDVSSTELGYLNGVTSAIQTQLDGKQAVVANVSDTEIGYLDGVTSAIQTQLNGKQAVVANVSDTEIGYLDGVTSAIQTQLDAKVAATVVDAKGDLLVGSADNTVARLQVGTNTYVLTANSGATYGVEWAAVPASAPDSENAIVAAAVFI